VAAYPLDLVDRVMPQSFAPLRNLNSRARCLFTFRIAQILVHYATVEILRASFGIISLQCVLGATVSFSNGHGTVSVVDACFLPSKKIVLIEQARHGKLVQMFRIDASPTVI
jgi:hypothetical protein